LQGAGGKNAGSAGILSLSASVFHPGVGNSRGRF
jgi:hypothetical protein